MQPHDGAHKDPVEILLPRFDQLLAPHPDVEDDGRPILAIKEMSIHNILQRSYLEVVENFPLGENCKCLTSAECAAKSCVNSKLLSLCMREATLVPLNVVATLVPDITLDIDASLNTDEVRAGEENGLLGEDVAD